VLRLNFELISIVLPVYNQADHIGSVIEEYIAGFKALPLPYELLPIVNGRRLDNSLAICRELESRHGNIRVFCIDEGGWGRAVRYGLAQARGDLLCYTNSARTTVKDLLLSLVYGSIHPDSVIKVNRKIREGRRRRLGSLLYNLECRALYDLPYWDVNGTPKVFPRKFSTLMELARNDDLIDLEFNAICRRDDYPVIEIPIFSSTRHSGKSTTSLKSAFHMYREAWKMRKQFSKR
jgi:dolichol-phosphate mannosyltransferase